VHDDDIFDDGPVVAGPPEWRARSFMQAAARQAVDAIVAIRGGYGSAELLPLLDGAPLRRSRTAFVGYSDLTALHTYLNCHFRLASVHGAMIAGRLAQGTSTYDEASWIGCLGRAPLGEL